jgi:hypothetical protein
MVVVCERESTRKRHALDSGNAGVGVPSARYISASTRSTYVHDKVDNVLMFPHTTIGR